MNNFDDILASRIYDSFAYHRPATPGLDVQLHIIRQRTKELADLYNWNVPNGREKAMAITRLEEAAMWAIKGMVLSEPVPDNEDLT